MPLKLPEESTPKKRAVKVKPKAPKSDALSVEDTIEYGITLEVSPQRGQKAWVKMGATSSVREGESAEEARLRVCQWVEESLDARVDELS